MTNEQKFSSSDLIIVSKFQDFLNYVYPIVQRLDRRHGYLKQKFINLCFEEVETFYKALKSSQKSKLYEADANLASIRFYMRFFVSKPMKIMTQKQQTIAEIKLAEVGSILNTWINKVK